MDKKMDIRTVTIKGIRYLREEDVAAYLMGLAATEPTDTRSRIEQAASNLVMARYMESDHGPRDATTERRA